MFRYVSRYTLTSLISPVSILMLAIIILSLRLPLYSWLSFVASTPNSAMFIYPFIASSCCTSSGIRSSSVSNTVTLGPSLFVWVITRYNTATMIRITAISTPKMITFLLFLAARCLADTLLCPLLLPAGLDPAGRCPAGRCPAGRCPFPEGLLPLPAGL